MPKSNDLELISLMVEYEPTIKTINQANNKTIIVLIAVAIVESVFLIPILASIDVIPAKKAAPSAYKSHIITLLITIIVYLITNKLNILL